MKKNNYKPRIVEFISPFDKRVYRVDTRKGLNGHYPGDELHDDRAMLYRQILVLGVGVNGFLTIAFKNETTVDIVYDVLNVLRYKVIVKRHAQHLIDSGEMIQADEL